MRDAGPTRRAVLGTVAVATIAVTVAGCDSDDKGSDQGRNKADDAARKGAYAATAVLLARYDAVAAKHAPLAARITPLSAELREHLALFAGTAKSPTPAPAPPVQVPEEAAAASSAAADWAQQGSDERLTALAAVSPELARRFASTSACLAGHAQLLRSTS
ncbi:hypothetical protein [Streptomyces sp. SID3343]|uniref:hypothetical protein n=1 Tax=Streptomyces sp. SID3343 TaxID=2690260 RepID=UPI001370117F|nr:hypothetical protein [Streptomyces sp. SID3343]MYW01683.1 hypothetical protein [Streptomyces sp. SID3343]